MFPKGLVCVVDDPKPPKAGFCPNKEEPAFKIIREWSVYQNSRVQAQTRKLIKRQSIMKRGK